MRRSGTVVGATLGLAALVVALAPLLARIARSWPDRVAVAGHSMEPTLKADDWLLVDPEGFAAVGPLAGDLVVALDPHDKALLIVKRVASVGADGRLRVAGDHPAHAGDDELIGPLERSAIVGRPWLRYWPAHRLGRL